MTPVGNIESEIGSWSAHLQRAAPIEVFTAARGITGDPAQASEKVGAFSKQPAVRSPVCSCSNRDHSLQMELPPPPDYSPPASDAGSEFDEDRDFFSDGDDIHYDFDEESQEKEHAESSDAWESDESTGKLTPVTYAGVSVHSVMGIGKKKKKNIDSSAELISLMRRLLNPGSDDYAVLKRQREEDTDISDSEGADKVRASVPAHDAPLHDQTTTVSSFPSTLRAGDKPRGNTRSAQTSFRAQLPSSDKVENLRRQLNHSKQRIRKHTRAMLRCMESSQDIVTSISARKAVEKFQSTSALHAQLQSAGQAQSSPTLPPSTVAKLATGTDAKASGFNTPDDVSLHSIGSMEIADLEIEPELPAIHRRTIDSLGLVGLEDRARAIFKPTRSYFRRGMSATAALLRAALAELSCYKLTLQFLSLSPATEYTSMTLVHNRVFVRVQMRRRRAASVPSQGLDDASDPDTADSEWLSVGETECILLPPGQKVYSFSHCPLLYLPTADVHGPLGTELRLSLIARTFTRGAASGDDTASQHVVEVSERSVGTCIVDLVLPLQRLGKAVTIALVPDEVIGQVNNSEANPLASSLSLTAFPAEEEVTPTSHLLESFENRPPVVASFSYPCRGFHALGREPEAQVFFNEQLRDPDPRIRRNLTSGLLMLFIDRIIANIAALNAKIRSTAQSNRTSKDDVVRLRTMRTIQIQLLGGYGAALKGWHTQRQNNGIETADIAAPESQIAELLNGADVLHHGNYCQLFNTEVVRHGDDSFVGGARPTKSGAGTVVFQASSSLSAELLKKHLPEELQQMLQRYHGQRLDSSDAVFGVESVQATLDAVVRGGMPRAVGFVGAHEDSQEPASPVQVVKGMSRKASVDPLFRVGGLSRPKMSQRLRAYALQTSTGDAGSTGSALSADSLAVTGALVMTARDKVFVRALNVAMNAFIEVARVRWHESGYWDQVYSFGQLIYFESLLSTRDVEAATLEDLFLGVKMLRRVRVHVEAIPRGESGASDELIQVHFVDANRRREYEVRVDPRAFCNDDEGSMFGRSFGDRDASSITLVPVLLSQGIDADQAFANRVGSNKLQFAVNEASLATLKEYCDSIITTTETFNAANGTSPGRAAIEGPHQGIDVEILNSNMSELQLSKTDAAMNIRLLLAARRVVEALRGGVAMTSGNDPSRVCMAATLHNAASLVKDHGLSPEHMDAYLASMRLCGVSRELAIRCQNESKDSASGQYKLDVADLQNMPSLLRPPVEATVVAQQTRL